MIASPCATAALEDDWTARQKQSAETEELRRRQTFASARKLQSSIEAAEVKYGFLVSQV